MPTSFWSTYVRLCNEHNIAPNAVAEKIGITSASVTGWKNGSVPRSTTLQRIADYFAVPVTVFTESTSEPAKPVAENPIIAQIREEAKGLTAEQLRQVCDFIDFLKMKK